MSRIAEGGVFGALLRGADETPDDVFFSLRSAQVELSFATLKERIAAGAVELRAHGVKPGDVVLIMRRVDRPQLARCTRSSADAARSKL